MKRILLCLLCLLALPALGQNPTQMDTNRGMSRVSGKWGLNTNAGALSSFGLGGGSGGDVYKSSNNVYGAGTTQTMDNLIVTNRAALGSAVITTLLDMGGGKVTNAAPATASKDLVTLGQMLATNAAGGGIVSVTNSILSFTFDSPTSGTNNFSPVFSTAATINGFKILCVGQTNILMGLDICDANGNNPVPVGLNVLGTNGGLVSSASLTNTTVPAGGMVRCRIESVTGAVFSSTVTVPYN